MRRLISKVSVFTIPASTITMWWSLKVYFILIVIHLIVAALLDYTCPYQTELYWKPWGLKK